MKINMPRFTAEAAILPSGRHYGKFYGTSYSTPESAVVPSAKIVYVNRCYRECWGWTDARGATMYRCGWVCDTTPSPTETADWQ